MFGTDLGRKISQKHGKRAWFGLYLKVVFLKMTMKKAWKWDTNFLWFGFLQPSAASTVHHTRHFSAAQHQPIHSERAIKRDALRSNSEYDQDQKLYWDQERFHERGL
jgi:hypothetical protein